ncbi:MAG: hypothetical protein EOP07_08840 [Proteobacteria bacterium]|nr:MAG: hypothetical protein EOP07_08840 [Pseudomonadota bacterium]
MKTILLTVGLILSFGSACSRSPVSAVQTDKSKDGEVEPLSSSPVLSTEPNCADLEKGDQGHSPIRSMNHCPPAASPETKDSVRAQNQLGGR